ncbi:MAG: DUF2125 domain-containing protein [Pseudomonadota bacterium]|nr:DUF2125 domain-containing protein [Pseudomonadota bacterium]MEC8039695.1 DUF2125 domain-containing protein [Pseudomonadota bacterium]MEC8293840.1 DUF2125 domain-containing protein [Pseudomonadota bacterium]
MKQPLTFCSPVIAALMLGAPVAHADVTPQEVWESWLSQMEPFGYEVSATETQMGNDLEISDLVMNIDIPEEDGSVEVSMPGFTFVDKGDGTVALEMPAIYPIVAKFSGDGEEGQVNINYNTTGLSMVASGEPDAINYAYSAASVEMSVGEIMAEGQTMNLGDISVTMVNANGNSLISGTELMSSDQEFSADQLILNVDVKDPMGSEEGAIINATLNDVTFDSLTAFPMAMDPEDFGKAMAQGLAMDFGLAHNGADIAFDINADGERVSGTQNAASGEFGLAFDAEGFALSQQAFDAAVSMQVPDLPFPVSYELGEASMEISVPLAMADEEQDFKLAVTLADFAVPDMLWSVFDPTAQLPRDPATVSFDVTGTVKILADLFAPEAMMMDEPGELHSVSINDIHVSMVGAELTGAGAFTFDNTDKVSFDGMPRPEGSVELSLTGGNALMDKAVAMGLASEEDVMGARMMMGMFTVPGEGEDSLKSTIEVNAEGHVMANGMRLK